MSELRRQAAQGQLARGTTVRVTRTFTRDELERFGQLTRDYNPVHYEPRWYTRKGYPTPICHGLLVGSMVCEPGGQWGWLATGMSFEFRRPVYLGDTVVCEMRITELDERGWARAECTFTNQHGEVVLTGDLEGFLPAADEQDLLGQLVAEGDLTNELRD